MWFMRYIQYIIIISYRVYANSIIVHNQRNFEEMRAQNYYGQLIKTRQDDLYIYIL